MLIESGENHQKVILSWDQERKRVALYLSDCFVSLSFPFEGGQICLSQAPSWGARGQELGLKVAIRMERLFQDEVLKRGKGLSFELDKTFQEALANAFFCERFVITLLTRFQDESFFFPQLFQKKTEQKGLMCFLEGQKLTFDLIDCPPNQKTPLQLKERIEDRFRDQPVQIRVVSSEELREDGFELIGAVSGGQGFLLELALNEGASLPWVLIGKGVTYDTGGLCLKSHKAMRNMKKDMGGLAAVVGFLHYLCLMKESSSFLAYLPIVENSIQRNAFRPGDVYKSGDKKVEIEHTDAEGRLILADAIGWARANRGTNWKGLVTFATLTGAARVALGTEIDACFTNQGDWLQRIHEISQKTGDWLWPLPLYESYGRYLKKTEIADLLNTSDFPAGCIEAALFLNEFVGEVPWLHLDAYMWANEKGLVRDQGPNPKNLFFLREFLLS